MFIFTHRPRLAAYIIGLLILIASFTTIYTQIILGEIVNMGLAVPPTLRFTASAANFASMFVLWGAILAIAFTASMIIAARIARAIGILPIWVHAVSGWAGIAATLFLMEWGGEAVLGVNIIVASRGLDGFIALSLAGLPAGYIYRALIERYRTPA
ncbi:MAG: hypothetical protein HAW65_04755 [Alphaproteobacteria bacterium]|nr:hypothetical protein [Alphaproteobacteria bacterium]MBE8220598.1 hypothetical protein [Alphaproteobacteria bacterium]